MLLIVFGAAASSLFRPRAWCCSAPKGCAHPPSPCELRRSGSLLVTGQSLCVYACSLALVAVLYLFFERTLYGKALRATAVNRIGARLSGISTSLAGRSAFCSPPSSACFPACSSARSPRSTMTRASGGAEGLCRGHHRRAGELSARRCRRDPDRHAGVLRLVLGQRLQGGNRLHADHSHPAVAILCAPGTRTRKNEGARAARFPCSLCSQGAPSPHPSTGSLCSTTLACTRWSRLASVCLPASRGRCHSARPRLSALAPMRRRGLPPCLGSRHGSACSLGIGVTGTVGVVLGPGDDAPLRALPAAWHDCVGHQPVLPVRQSAELGGFTGVTGIPPVSLFGFELRSQRTFFYAIWASALQPSC